MECEQLFAIIEKLNGKYLDILEDVCNIESPTDYKKGVDEVGKYFVDMAEKFGFETEILKQNVSGNVVCITLNPDSEKAPVTLSAHMDTVHPLGSFGTPAVKRDNDKMYGPGVMDCKGGAVAAFMAMDALKKCGYKERPVMLILQSDEENSSKTSGKATIEYMCEKSKDSVAFLNLEGIQGNTAVLQRKGILRYLFTVHGKALHSSRCFDAASAVCEAAYKIIELEKMKDAEEVTCNCVIKEGGTTANTVAEKCCFYADIRFSTADELENVKIKVKEIADNITVKGCSCETEEISFCPAMVLADKNVELLKK